MTVVPVTQTPNGEKRNEGMTARYSRLRAVFDVGTALLLADAGFDLVGMVPVLLTDFPSGWQERTL